MLQMLKDVKKTLGLGAAAAAPTATEIRQRTVNLVVTWSRFGNRRKIATTQLDVKAGTPDQKATDKKLLTASKRLMNADEMKAIDQHDAQTRQHLWNIIVSPHPLYRRGVYMLAVKTIEEAESYLRERSAIRLQLVETLVHAWPALVDQMRGPLGPLFNVLDYPHADDLRRLYGFSWRYASEETPDQLAEISPEFFASQRDKVSDLFTSAIDEMRDHLRVALQEIVDHMVTALADAGDGTRKKFHKTLLGRLDTFLDTFDVRNVTDDAALQRLVTQVRDIRSGLDVSQLKTSDAVRHAVHEQLAITKTAIDALVVSSADRAIR